MKRLGIGLGGLLVGGFGPSQQASAKLAVANSWQLHFSTLILQDFKLSGTTWVTEFLLNVKTTVFVPNPQHRLALSSSCHILHYHPNKALGL